jgi:uncharacterized membrane protein
MMWLVIGLVLGAGLLRLNLWLRQHRVAVLWYDWLLAGLGLVLLLLAIQNFSTSLAEYEIVAAWNSLLIFGVMALFLVYLASFLVWRRYRRNKIRNTL